MAKRRSRAAWNLPPVAVVVVCSALGAVLAGWSGAGLRAEEDSVATLTIGSPAPEFTLPGVDDRDWSLRDFAEAKVLFVVFTCNHCPTAQVYEDRLIELHHDFVDRGVRIVAISPNDPEAVNLGELGYSDLGDSLDDMKQRAKDKGFPFPYLYDGETQSVSRAFGVQATPHVFIFDAARTLRYVGRIDDDEIDPPKSHDARNALEALLAGRDVPRPTTKVFGCSTKWAGKKDYGRELLKQWDAEEVALDDLDLDGVKQLASNSTDNFRLVNVWATWCAPCVDELPMLTEMNRMYRRRRFELVTISLDDAGVRDRAQAMLTEAHLSAKNYRYSGDDRDALVEALDPEWAGPAPYTLLIAPGGEIVYRKQGPIDPLALKRAIVEKIGRTYASDRKPSGGATP